LELDREQKIREEEEIVLSLQKKRQEIAKVDKDMSDRNSVMSTFLNQLNEMVALCAPIQRGFNCLLIN
jgi:hypothetical protein